VPGTSPVPDLMTLIQRIESAGFDGAGILDSQMLSRDAFVVLRQAATHTARLDLFPAVTNPFTRHASVLASAIRTVEAFEHVERGARRSGRRLEDLEIIWAVRTHRDSGRVRRADRRDDQARRTESLPHASPDLRSSRG
jgi:hypothetical protein